MRHLPKELSQYGENVLLVYGKNSIKKMGLYDDVLKILNEMGKNVIELAGIKSNPSYTQLLEGARLVRENQINLILAVGGGSVVDCAKGISVAAYCEGEPWEQPSRRQTISVFDILLLQRKLQYIIFPYRNTQ